MKRQSVQSSNIASIGYDKKTSTLEVEFIHGGIYQYFHVPAHVYKDFMDASSKGQFLHDYIKGSYTYKKL